jgi:hypothetical protein
MGLWEALASPLPWTTFWAVAVAVVVVVVV